MRKHAPIIIFAFNRLETLKRCVTSLQKNTEAKDSDLFVFVDGVRPNIQGEQDLSSTYKCNFLGADNKQ